jgi:hypothetical protein
VASGSAFLRDKYPNFGQKALKRKSLEEQK